MIKKLSLCFLVLWSIFTFSNLHANDLKSTTISPIKFKGDFRFRYQSGNFFSNDTRVRYRVRFRLSAKSKISKTTSVHAGLATGGTDARSTNQTLNNQFETPDIRFDYAFVKHSLFPKTTLFAGKMKNPFWRPSDLLWDSDIRPDGIATTIKADIKETKTFINAGYFILQEFSNTKNDIYFLALQPGAKIKINSSTTFKTAIGYYQTQHLKGNTLANSEGTNTNSSEFQDDFASLTVSSKLCLYNKFNLNYISPFIELVTNVNEDSNKNGAIVGVTFGEKKVKGKGKWQSKVSYRYLEADAWLDTFPDSDAYGGVTNAEGFEFIINYGLSPKSKLALDIYDMNVINGSNDKQTLAQIDYSVKF